MLLIYYFHVVLYMTIKNIIEFISKNKNKTIDCNLYDVNLIKNLLIIVKNTFNEHINLKYDTIKIHKLHSNHCSLLFDLFKEYKSIDNITDFVKYYTLNQHNIDLKTIKNDIKNNDKLINIYNKIYNNVGRKEICDIFCNNTFVSIDVLTELETNDLINVTVNNEDLYLSVYYYDIKNVDVYLTNIIRIIKIIKNINTHFNHKNIKFNVIMFLGNCTKNFSGSVITPYNINSGSSIVNIYASVWRKEEYEKVLIHELLHFIETDFICDSTIDLQNKISDLIKYEGINSCNESYNETMAGIINMCYKSIKHDININKIYEIELNFLYIQSAKMIMFFNGENIADLFNKKITIKQTTSALSYILFKMILFHNIFSTVDFIEKINFKCNTMDKIKMFDRFFIGLINDRSYFDVVDYYISILKNIDKNNYIVKNLRMSLI